MIPFKAVEMEATEMAEVDLETILSKFKLLGPYYVKMIILVALLAMTNEMYFLNYIFAAEDVNYRCKYPEYENDSVSFNDLPIHLNWTRQDKCNRYAFIQENASCSIDKFNMPSAVSCDEWSYEKPNSFVAEFQLACQDWKRTFVGTVHSFGYMIGLLIVGPLSDKIGRKKTIILTAFLSGVVGLTKSVVSSYWFYVTLETMEAAIGDSCSPTFTYAVEMATKENRVLFSTVMQVTYALSDLLMAILAWSVPYWRNFLRTIYAPALLYILYWFFLDESVRWLLSTGRKREAVQILKKAAKESNVCVDEDTLQRIKCEKKTSNASLISLLKMTVSSRKLLLRFLGCIVLWTTNSFTYQALMINSVGLKGDKYLNFGLMALAFLPAALSVMYILVKFKRKKPLVISLLFTGIFGVAQPFVPTDYGWASSLLFFAGKFASSISNPTLYLYTSELFPTYTRNTMHAMCSALGRLGAILATQTPLLVPYWSGLPAVLIGALSLLAALVGSLMADSADDILPDNVHQAEAVGLKTSPGHDEEDDNNKNHS